MLTFVSSLSESMRKEKAERMVTGFFGLYDGRTGKWKVHLQLKTLPMAQQPQNRGLNSAMEIQRLLLQWDTLTSSHIQRSKCLCRHTSSSVSSHYASNVLRPPHIITYISRIRKLLAPMYLYHVIIQCQDKLRILIITTPVKETERTVAKTVIHHLVGGYSNCRSKYIK